MGRLCVCWVLVFLAVPALGAGLTGEVEQRRAAELEAQQSAIRSSQQSGSGAGLEQRMQLQRRRRGQQMERFRFEQQQQQQRQQTLPPPPSLAPLQLQSSPAERAEQDTRRRAREIERLQQQTSPNR